MKIVRFRAEDFCRVDPAERTGLARRGFLRRKRGKWVKNGEAGAEDVGQGGQRHQKSARGTWLHVEGDYELHHVAVQRARDDRAKTGIFQGIQIFWNIICSLSARWLPCLCKFALLLVRSKEWNLTTGRNLFLSQTSNITASVLYILTSPVHFIHSCIFRFYMSNICCLIIK